MYMIFLMKAKANIAMANRRYLARDAKFIAIARMTT